MTMDDTAPGALSEHSPSLESWLTAIIEGSDDAIISKDTSGIIKSWNPGAARIFGYEPAEVIGRSITVIIPEERLSEEADILSRIRSGTKVEHFETVRRRKGGEMIHVSLTVSPIRDATGKIVGASKIARDITETHRLREREKLLAAEMAHRVKNVFALTAGIVSLSAQLEDDPEELARTIRERLSALARAHALTIQNSGTEPVLRPGAKLSSLIGAILEPYAGYCDIAVEGGEFPLDSSTTSALALILHELATNAAKYGALSVSDGTLRIAVERSDAQVVIRWTEGNAPPSGDPGEKGFGGWLEQEMAQAMQATIERHWSPTGLTVVIAFQDPQMQATA